MAEKRPRPSAGQSIALLAFAVLGACLPFASDALSARWLALSLLALSLLVAATLRGSVPVELAPSPGDVAVLFCLLALGAFSDDRRWLRLVPAWAFSVAARALFASLRAPVSLFERVVLWMEPHAPDFVRPYVRKLTIVWGTALGLNAFAIAALALAGSPAWWSRWTRFLGWACLTALAAAEFLFRRLHFRNYGTGPFDRVLARLFPSEATALGRRSIEYRREMRISLGREP